jgi:hypothetical protein
VRREPAAFVADQQVAIPGDRVERSPDLVREVGEELALEPRRGLDLARPLLLDLLRARELGGQSIEVLVLLARDLHEQRALLEARHRARGELGLDVELLAEQPVLPQQLLDSLSEIHGHAGAPAVRAVVRPSTTLNNVNRSLVMTVLTAMCKSPRCSR